MGALFLSTGRLDPITRESDFIGLNCSLDITIFKTPAVLLMNGEHHNDGETLHSRTARIFCIVFETKVKIGPMSQH